MPNKLSLKRLHMQYFFFSFLFFLGGGVIYVFWLCPISKYKYYGANQGKCSSIGVNYFYCSVYIPLATKGCDAQRTQSMLTFFNRLPSLNYHRVIKMCVAAFRILQLTRLLIFTTYFLLKFQLCQS